MIIALLSCTSKKKTYRCSAKEMYSESPIFRRAYEYADLTCDEIYILSAKFGLLSEESQIEPYNLTLNDKNSDDRRAWSEKVLLDIEDQIGIEGNHFIILAGKNYHQYLLAELVSYELPLAGKTLGNWIPTLKNLISQTRNPLVASDLHRYLLKLPRYNSGNIDEIQFDNGVYIVFDKNEIYHGVNRIVRVGTHTSDGNLRKRLKQHFRTENQRSSVFRKNVGRCLLNSQGDSYLQYWNAEKSATGYDPIIEKQLEQEISRYLNENLYVVCLEIHTKESRLRIEDGIIALLNNTDDFQASEGWLGNCSSEEKISRSGLWCKHGLNGEPLIYGEFEKIKNNFYAGESPENLSSSLSQINLIPKKNIKSKRSGTKVIEVQKHINNLKAELVDKRVPYVDLKSGDIHKKLGLSNAMPTVCSAMYKAMGERDVILHTTPSGKSSTIIIRYFID